MNSVPNPAQEDLLNLYLSMPKDVRDKRFIGTSQAAEYVGVSQRTIQSWIEIGAIRAVRIIGKYKVDLDSLRHFLGDREM